MLAIGGSVPVTSLPKMLPDGELEIPMWAGERDDEPFDVKQFLRSRMPPDNDPHHLLRRVAPV